MNKIVNGYYDAAKAVNPDITVLAQYTNSYVDMTVAQEIAENAIQMSSEGDRTAEKLSMR